MHFVAMTRKKHEKGNERSDQRDKNEATCSRLALSRRDCQQQCKNGICDGADDETRLKSEPWQQNESGENRTNRCASRVEQRCDSNAVDPAPDSFLNA